MTNPSGIGGWQKGQSGNPNGRPPAGLSPTTLLRRALEEEYRPGITKLEYLVGSAVDYLVRQAERGELTPGDLAWLTSRLDGAPLMGLPVEQIRERQEAMDKARLDAAQGAQSARSFSHLRAMGQA